MTQIPTMFYIGFFVAMAMVALIWVLVIAITIFNAVRAIKGKNSEEKAKTKKTHIQPIAPALDDSTSTPTPTIAGMPAGAYYATLTNWTIH